MSDKKRSLDKILLWEYNVINNSTEVWRINDE